MSRSSKQQKSLIKKSMRLNMNQSNLSSYQDIKSSMRPFDLIAFRGGDIVSDLITELENEQCGVGDFSHVGMVVTAEILPVCHIQGKEFNLDPNKIYVFESTFSHNVAGITDGPHDVVTGKGKLGVQLRDLEEVIPRYITSEKTKVAWCRLLNNPFDKPNADRDGIREEFTKFFEEYEMTLYEVDFNDLMAAMFPSLRILRNIQDYILKNLFKVLHSCGLSEHNTGPAGWQFCSELVGNVYQLIGVLPKHFDPRDVLPVDFFGYDIDGIPALVAPPIYIRDWDIQESPAFHYELDK